MFYAVDNILQSAGYLPVPLHLAHQAINTYKFITQKNNNSLVVNILCINIFLKKILFQKTKLKTYVFIAKSKKILKK